MTAELAETDRLRRDLVANVSHELRTPLGALQAVLENLVDGVAARPRDAAQRCSRRPTGWPPCRPSCSTCRAWSPATAARHRPFAFADVIERRPRGAPDAPDGVVFDRRARGALVEG